MKHITIGLLGAVLAMTPLSLVYADGKTVASGGRVLNVTTRAGSLRQARDAAYGMVDRIDWPEGFCRRDIGWRVLD